MEINVESKTESFQDLSDRLARFANFERTYSTLWEGRNFYIEASSEEKQKHVDKMDFLFYGYFFKSIAEAVELHDEFLLENLHLINGTFIPPALHETRDQVLDSVRAIYLNAETSIVNLWNPLLLREDFPDCVFGQKLNANKAVYDRMFCTLDSLKINVESIVRENLGGGISVAPFGYKPSKELVAFSSYLIEDADRMSVVCDKGFDSFKQSKKEYERIGVWMESYNRELKKVVQLMEIGKISEKILLVDNYSPHLFLQLLLLIIKHVQEVRVTSLITKTILEKSL